MTPEQIINKSYQHLIKQGHRAVNDNGNCLYRTAEGEACGVGCLLSDEVAQSWDAHFESEDSSISTIIATQEVPDWIKDNKDLLVSIQTIHDNTITMDWYVDITKRYTRLAQQYEVTLETI